MTMFVIVGKAGSGKTTLSKELSRRTNLQLVETSDYLKKIGKVKDRHKDRRDMYNVKNKFEKDDPDWLWKELKKDLDKLNGDCILSGIREPYLLYRVFNEYDNVCVIGLDVSLFNRYGRICQRDGFISIEDFYSNDADDKKLGIDITLSGCEVVIDCNRSMKEIMDVVIKIASRSMINR